MSDNTATQRSKTKPSAPSSDGIVELKPPVETGFSGTALLRAIEDAVLIEELLKRGYVTVSRG